MKRIASGLLMVLTAAWAGGCGMKMPKMEMPELKMPKMLQEDPPEVKVQKRIASVLKSQDDIELYREVADLLEVTRKVNWDGGRLLKEVLDYCSKVEGDKQMARYQRLLELLKAPKSALVDAAASRLGKAQGQEAEACRSLLRWASPPDPRGAADFTQFSQYLTSRQAQLPQELVLWMYDRDAAAAMEVMMGIYGTRLAPADAQAIVIAARVLDQMAWKIRVGLASAEDDDEMAMQQLETLAKLPQWWARLYVAEALTKYPGLRKAGVVSRLSKDDNSLVAAVMARLSGK